jgi:hypothetical protein
MQATHRKARLPPPCANREILRREIATENSKKRLALLKSDRAALASGGAGAEI